MDFSAITLRRILSLEIFVVLFLKPLQVMNTDKFFCYSASKTLAWNLYSEQLVELHIFLYIPNIFFITRSTKLSINLIKTQLRAYPRVFLINLIKTQLRAFPRVSQPHSLNRHLESHLSKIALYIFPPSNSFSTSCPHFGEPVLLSIFDSREIKNK